MKNKKGFTLIELLIVIAIIGILASIVLVSLNSARSKARVAAYKSVVASLAPAFQVCCDSTSNSITAYSAGTDVCSSPILSTWPTLAQLNVSAVTVAGNGACPMNGAYSITITPGSGNSPLSACDTAATITPSGVTFPTGC